jgi:hypothetical protein
VFAGAADAAAYHHGGTYGYDRRGSQAGRQSCCQPGGFAGR